MNKYKTCSLLALFVGLNLITPASVVRAEKAADSVAAITASRDWGFSTDQWDAFSMELFKLEESNLLRELGDYPESRLFGRDRQKIRYEMDQRLREFLKIVANSPLVGIQARASALRTEIGELGKKQSSCIAKAESAKDSVSLRQKGLNYLGESVLSWTCLSTWSKESLLRTAQETGVIIENKKAELQSVLRELEQHLSAMGIKSNPQQVETQFMTLSGPQEAHIVSLFKNFEAGVKIFQEQMRNLQNSGQFSAAIAERYYGSYAMMLRTLRLGHVVYVEKIDKELIPRLQTLQSNLATEVQITRGLLRGASSASDRQQYQANLDINQRSQSIAKAYIEFLRNRRASITDSIAVLDAQYALAENTFIALNQTQNIGEIVSQISSLEALINLQPPPMVTFESREMLQEFVALTSQLK